MVLLQTMLFTLFSNREVQSTQEIILNQGFSFESFIRGIIGMCVLILIAYIFSKDRKAINWKTTIIGLVTQLILAIAVLKVVRNITGLGLKESKEIVDNTPKVLKEGATKEECETIKKDVEAAGGKVVIPTASAE